MLKHNKESIGAITKLDIANDMAEYLDITKDKSGNIVEIIFLLIKENVSINKKLKVKNFGNFKLKLKRERVGRNPRTSESIKIAPRNVVTFYYSKTLRTNISTKNYFFNNGNYSKLLSAKLLKVLNDKNFDINTSHSYQMINTFFNILTHYLINRKRIEIRNFGVFEIRKYKAYKARNPKTGETIFIDEKELPFFKYSKGFIFI